MSPHSTHSTDAERISTVNSNSLLISSTTIGAAVIGVFVGVIVGMIFKAKLLRRKSKNEESQNQVQLTAISLPGPLYEEIKDTTDQVKLSCNIAYDSAHKATLSQ